MSQDTPVAMFPKPDKRGPKKPKPLARATKPIPRKVKVKKVRKTPVSRLMNQAKALWSEIIRLPGRCHFIGRLVGKKIHECGGPLQGMHKFGKGAYPAVRYDLDNGVCGCRDVHAYYTHHPEEFGLWMAADWGPDMTATMMERKNADVKHNRAEMEVILAHLRAELAARQQQYPAAA